MMLRFLLIAVLLFLAGRALRTLFSNIVAGVAARPRATSEPPQSGEKMVRDPVCGTFIVPSRSIAVRGKDGAVYFCSEKCRSDWKKQSA